MAIRYKAQQWRNPNAPEEPKKFYAKPAFNGIKDIDNLAVEISRATSMTKADVKAVLDILVEIIPAHLLDGYIVQLGELGTFRMAFSSKGVDKPEELLATYIRDIRIMYKPSTTLKSETKKVSFQKDDSIKNDSSTTDSVDDEE